MSCKNCEKEQEKGLVSHYRWKNANIIMIGCDKHLKEIFSVLNLVKKGN